MLCAPTESGFETTGRGARRAPFETSHHGFALGNVGGPGGMYALYATPALVFANSSRTAFTLFGSAKRSIIVAASAFDARIIPLCPIDIPPHATTDQPCHGTPTGAVATDR